jgi:beta-glucosidase
MPLFHRAGIFAVILGLMLAAPGLRADEATDRATKIVAAMTLDEKIAQMHGTLTKGPKGQARIVIGLPRLGIPDLLVTNGPAGFGPAGPGHQGKATALPAPIALAATWDLDAAHDYGVIEGSEALDFGNTFFEAPDINIARVPQNGRTFEAFGEDPWLVSRLAVANIEAIQSQGIIANVKHYAANNQETYRGYVNVVMDERTMREIYLPAFEASVKEAGVASVMGAYNKVNGAFCCENQTLLTDILKKEWGFTGFVSSDFGAVHSTVPTALNGLDLEMPDGKYLGGPLKAAVQAGQVPESVIDEHLVRRFSTMMRMGVWDHPPVKKPIPAEANGAIARRIAEEAAVLLRNQNRTLPLDPTMIRSVALIGPYADHASTGGGGSSHVDPLYSVTPLVGLQKRLGPGVAITLVRGTELAPAIQAAKSADVAIVMVGDKQSEGKDHPLSLGVDQDALVVAVALANPRTIVVVKSGGPVLMPWSRQIPAILEAWYPGEEDGNVVADLLTGAVNPSGKLPITFPDSEQQGPARTLDQYPGVGPKPDTAVNYSEGALVGYRWYDAKNIRPLYPFGYGLSYTTFAYRNLNVVPASASPSGMPVNFDVTNTGKCAGSEVAQVYVTLPATPDLVQPPRQLKGFVRLTLAAGETQHAQVVLPPRAFSDWDTASHGWKSAAGDVTISVGGSSRDLPLSSHVSK